VQYLLNYWNRYFFDALERRDAAALWTQAELFVPLAAASVVLGATSVWGRMTTQRKWRECVTRQVIEYWLANDKFRRLDPLAADSANPEYRISEDVRVATDPPVDLVLAFFASVLTAIVFLSVLWSVGGSIAFEAFGRSWTIPGYLVISVVIYSTLFSSAMLIVGRQLTGVIERKNQSEAEFRAAADRLLQVKVHGEEGNGTRRMLWEGRACCPRALAKPLMAAGADDSGLAQQRYSGASHWLAALRSQISRRNHISRGADAIGRRLRRRSERLQLAGRQLRTHRRLEIVGQPGRHPPARSR
jgi:hypothetical protein